MTLAEARRILDARRIRLYDGGHAALPKWTFTDAQAVRIVLAELRRIESMGWLKK